MRVVPQTRPFDAEMARGWSRIGRWPAHWIAREKTPSGVPRVEAYRLKFKVDAAQKSLIHVSADERYELFLDGVRLGRGPERGDRMNWHFETYQIDLSAGEHVLVARTWWLGPEGPAPYAQMMLKPGFLLAAEGDLHKALTTGEAPWEAKLLGGYKCLPPGVAWGTGAKLEVDGASYDWGWSTGGGDGWTPAVKTHQAFDDRINDGDPVWTLTPSMLPPMLERPWPKGRIRAVQSVASDDLERVPVVTDQALEPWQALLEGRGSVILSPGTKVRVIVDWEDYVCGYPELAVSGGKGSKLRWSWAESLYTRAPNSGEWAAAMPKENRDEVDGRVFYGIGDVFRPDGESHRSFGTLWWEAGRYSEILFEVGEDLLTVEKMAVRETHYPYEFGRPFQSSDARLAEVTPIGLRTLEMCSHETYMDCPYYEQLMYVGDTRLEVLVTYATTLDDRLPRKAVKFFDVSRRPDGLTFSRYPSFITQFIPPFSLWWVAMVHDFARWRDDPEFVAERMPGVRAVLDFFRKEVGEDGLLRAPVGWNYYDWIADLPEVPIGSVHGPYNFHFAWVLRQAADLEAYLGEAELAERNRKLADRIASAAWKSFYNAERGLLADNLERTRYSEHAQCLAWLGGSVPEAAKAKLIQGLQEAEDLTRTTIYFRHYLFETLGQAGKTDAIRDRMGLWFEHPAKGLKTTIESPEPTRSDCHAWGAHPIFHYAATFLGIRPADFGFGRVRITPQLGSLEWASGVMGHPKGWIEVEVRPEAVNVTLPGDLAGELVLDGKTHPLQPGPQRISR